MNRRNVLQFALLSASALATHSRPVLASTASTVETQLARLEAEHGGRLGVFVLDTGNGDNAGHRADEKFLMCSTFKALAVAAILRRVDQGKEQLDRRIVFEKTTLLPNSPITEKHRDANGMTVAELCQAAITLSDNTAANLLLDSIGGPAGVTRFARALGDSVTRLDRIEPELNIATPGDERDTTTPRAMLTDLRKLTLDNTLADTSRQHYIDWLRGTLTGNERIRAGIPVGWTVGDKTGTGDQGEANDIAIVWPPNRAPLLIAAFYVNAKCGAAERSHVLSEVGRLAVESFTR